MSIKLTDFMFFQNLEETLNQVTPELMSTMEQGVAPSGQYLPLGIMPENLKALLYVYSAMVEERNDMSYQIFQFAAGKSQEEIQAEMSAVSIADKNINLISSLFFAALEYEYNGDGPVGQIGFFGPNFDVYVLL